MRFPPGPAVYWSLDISGRRETFYRRRVDRTTKPIHLTWHAEQRLERRGVTEGEIVEAIRTAKWEPTELGRLECRKNYPHGRRWNRVYYDTKQVRPVFVDEPHGIVVVTVYSYFFGGVRR